LNKLMLSSLVAVIGLAANAAAPADDANTDRPAMTYKQKMQACLDKARREQANASDADLKKTCAAKIQSWDQHPSETKSPPNNPTN
jgi:Ni/Co efflux regulator RcnB